MLTHIGNQEHNTCHHTHHILRSLIIYLHCYICMLIFTCANSPCSTSHRRLNRSNAILIHADRPLKANDYIKKALGSPTPEDYEKVVAENKRLQAELEAVREQLSELQQVSAPEATEPAEVTE